MFGPQIKLDSGIVLRPRFTSLSFCMMEDRPLISFKTQYIFLILIYATDDDVLCYTHIIFNLNFFFL